MHMTQRYDMRQDRDGSWSVIDIFTGQPVLVNERAMRGMDVQDADEMAELLNIRDEKKRKAMKR